MKLATFLADGEARLGATLGDRIVDLRAAAALDPPSTAVPSRDAAFADAVSFLQAGPDAVAAARAILDRVAALDPADERLDRVSRRVEDTAFLPPIPDPPKIICVARNYAEHAKEAGREISPIPIVFARFSSTLVGAGGAVVQPTVSDQLDWEGELAVVIGKAGRHVSKEDAMAHVAGYSIFNDVTVRDYQFRVPQYTSGKNFAASGPFGPYLVLTDEVPDPHALDITTKVNGETKQHGNTADLIYDIPTIIAHISEWIELQPGDVIPTGTPAGVGFSRNPPEFLRPGDTVSVTVTGLGTLDNPVVAEEVAA